MIVSWKPYNKNEYENLGTYNSEILKDYTYLGKILENNNELRQEIEKKAPNANTAYYVLLPVL
jgi:hypothetical protein